MEAGRYIFGPQTLRKINTNDQKIATNYEGAPHPSPWSWIIWAEVPVPACAVLHVVFPGWHKGHEKWKNSEVSLTLLVEAEVLQGLVEVPGRGDSADVPVGADGAQPRRAGPVPHRGQAPALCEAK